MSGGENVRIWKGPFIIYGHQSHVFPLSPIQANGLAFNVLALGEVLQDGQKLLP